MTGAVPISVLLPTHNAAATLPVALASILGQSEPDFELIVVDDGSTDGTSDYLAGIGDPRLRVMTRPHGGIVPALLEGLDAARGEYVARMDADDLSYPQRLARQRAYLAEHPDIGLVGSLVDFGGDRRRQLGYALYVDWQNRIVSSREVASARFVESPFAHPSVMFRRSLVERYGAYRDGPFPEDYELWLRWLDAGVRMAKVPEVLLRWNDPPSRLSRIDGRYASRAFFEVKADYLARWLARQNPFHPEVVIWGASRTARQRAELLTGHGVRIVGYIDMDPRKSRGHVRGRWRCHCSEMPGPEQAFVVSYVAKRGARQEIGELLRERGFAEGRQFIHAA